MLGRELSSDIDQHLVHPLLHFEGARAQVGKRHLEAFTLKRLRLESETHFVPSPPKFPSNGSVLGHSLAHHLAYLPRLRVTQRPIQVKRADGRPAKITVLA